MIEALKEKVGEKYALENETLIQVANDDPRSFTETEVGDIKQPHFIPQVKVKRFGNEFNFSARLKHSEKGKTSVDYQGEKIIWKQGELEAHFYDIENGYEFEVIFQKKPVSNVVEFTIQTKGLRFFYQPELTEAEKKLGRHRPENVIGSYAVYADSLKKTYVRGKRYGTGKVGHIYRPKCTDASGQEVWGELKIDTKKGILSVIVPQEFLDKATYPLIVDPTIGYDEVGGSSLDMHEDLNAFCSLYRTIIAAPGDIFTRIHFRARELDDNETIACNLYRIVGGTPTTKLTTDLSVNVNSTSAQWWHTSVVSVGLTAGYEYGVAYGGWGGDGGGVPHPNTRIYYDTSSGTNISYATTTSLPSTWDEEDTYSDLLSLYAEFTRADVDINYSFNLFIDKGKL